MVAQASYAGMRWESILGRRRSEGKYLLARTRLIHSKKVNGAGEYGRNEKLKF